MRVYNELEPELEPELELELEEELITEAKWDKAKNKPGINIKSLY